MSISDYIDNIKLDWEIPVCQQLHQTVLNAIPDVEERIQYGKPHYLKHGKYACVFGTAKGWVSFTIFNAQSLEPPHGFFEPTDKPERQTIKIHEGQAVDYKLLSQFIQQAAETIK